MKISRLPITVLMAVYNAENYLSAAINSILNQSYTEFELLIINDASTDASAEIIASYQDNRIRCITNDTNLNLCRSLAKGISLARGEFIARMDADDIAHPMRLEKQLAAMLACPELDLLGANVRWIDQSNNVIRHPKIISNPVDLRWNLFFKNCFNHPTVMIRKSALDRSGLNYGVIPDEIAAHFPEGLGGIGDEDYLLFGLLSLCGTVGNLDTTLLDYRIHRKSLTALFSEKQKEQTKRIAGALRSIYLHHSDTLGIVSNELKFPKLGLDRLSELHEINAIAQKMLHDFRDPVAHRRINIHLRLQRAILTQDTQGFLKRALVTLRIVFNWEALRWTDLPILLKYVFGARVIGFYTRHLRLRNR
jgi:glycosyltransferase involved in cell wall biosynthesis